MRMADLATESGCTVSTIKYYLREGLLPSGESRSATQADYGDAHLERLRVIRVLREVGDMPVSRIGEVLAAIDDSTRPIREVIATAHHALGPERSDTSAEHAIARQEMVDHVLARGWNVDSAARSFDVLAGALVALRGLGTNLGIDVFDTYADVAFDIAEVELASIDPSHGPSSTVTQVIVGTVVYEQALMALRRLAEEHHSNRRFAGPSVLGG